MPQQYRAALIQYIMRQNQIIKNGLNGHRSCSFPITEKDGDMQMTEARVYVGLNDAETREQKYRTEKYVNILKDVCRNYHVAFSVDIVQKIAQDLRTLFHQESVLVTEDHIRGFFVIEE